MIVPSLNELVFARAIMIDRNTNSSVIGPCLDYDVSNVIIIDISITRSAGCDAIAADAR